LHIVALILLTNDDGIQAEGLQVLRRSLMDLVTVIVVAPDRERSAVSHGLTIHDSLTHTQLDESQFSLNGTPADCIIYALARVIRATPDLVVSGINCGANLGDDIMYSGTVAGAREACRRGIPALAVSQAYDSRPVDFRRGARFIRLFVKNLLQLKNTGAACLNVNIPVRRIRGVKITRQGCASYFPHFNALSRASEAGLNIVGGEPPAAVDVPLDYQAVMDNYVSVTPLQRDQTDYAAVESLLRNAPGLFPRRRMPGLGLIR